MGASYSKIGTALKLYVVFAILHTLAKAYSLRKRIQTYKRMLAHVPGKKGFFNLDFVNNIQRLHDWRLNYIKDYRGESLVTTDGPGLSVICNDEESIKTILRDQFNVCTKPSNKDDRLFAILQDFLGRNGIFTLLHGKNLSSQLEREHKEWFFQRKTASKIFTKRQFETFMHDTFVEKMEHFIKVLDKYDKAGEDVDLQNMFFIFTMNSIQKLFFGRDINTLEAGVDVVGDNFDEAHRHMLKLNIETTGYEILAKAILPWPFGAIGGDTKTSPVCRLKSHYSPSRKAFDTAVNSLHTEIETIIKEARDDPKLGERKDLLANFLNSANKNLSNEYLRDVTLNFILAGRDTTACTLSWLFYELSINPSVQSALYEEVREKLNGKATPSYADLSSDNMPYLNGCIMETLRLHPPVPEDVKIASADVQFANGTIVPKGTRLIFCPYSLARDPKNYENPEEFNPRRWMPWKGYPPVYKFPVFQAGYRECLGKDMALFESKLVAAMLIQRFSFSLRPGEQEKITYSLMVTMSICNSGAPKSFDEDRSHELWIRPTRRPESL